MKTEPILMVALCGLFVLTSVQAEARPNVLVIMADDVGWMNVSSYGGDIMGVKTPNIDRIGKEGTRVNQYTLIMDVLIGETGPGAASMLQVSSLNNTDDGDLFWQGGNFGQGTDGYKGTGLFTAGAWHRVVAAYDMAAMPPRVTKYVDGVFQDDWTANQSLDNPRRALQATAVLFGDGDQDERREWWVNAVQIRAGALSKPEIESLGGPSADGIPVVLSVAAPEPPARPTISVAVDASGAPVITFTGILEASASVSDGYAPVAGATSPLTVDKNAAPAKFYRAKAQ